jgi:predicted esterase
VAFASRQARGPRLEEARDRAHAHAEADDDDDRSPRERGRAIARARTSGDLEGGPMRGRRALPLPPVALVAALALAASSPGAAPATRAAAAPSPARPEVALSRAEAEARAAAVAETSRLDAEARAPAADVRIAPSPRGVLGAWLVAGPFKAARSPLEAAPAGVDEAALAPSSGELAAGDRALGGGKKKGPARWTIASSNHGAIDLEAALEPTGSELVAYAAGSLHVERPGRYLLLLGVDDGVRVSVDGRVVLTRDDARPVRDDDDIVPLELTAGDHAVMLKLHQRRGAWAFRARFVDGTLAPPPGAYLRLPGTTPDDARALSATMAWVSLDRAFDGTVEPPRYRPTLTVRYPEGAPRGAVAAVRARLVGGPGDEPVFDVQAGGVPLTAAGASELVVALPSLTPFAATLTLETTVAGRVVKSPLPSRPVAERAVTRAEHALAKVRSDAPFLAEGSLDSMRYLTRRLGELLGHGDTDVEAQTDEARELDRMASAFEKSVDPFEGRTGPTRRALRSPIDGDFSELGVYVPPWYKPGGTRRFPLVVGLHGLNGYAMGVMRWLFGGDDPKRSQGWEDRHIGPLPPLDAFVITPLGHGNSLYRELGETDIMNAVAWAMRAFPIDPSRVTITGMSMGGIGSASVPLHNPHVFAAAEPLCGYHSYLIRGDVAGHALRPWERYLAEERSNVQWAENGGHLPLFIVHGTRDLPERNSGVLIDRYEELHFAVKHEHPEAGHNVWQQTYEELKGLTWLLNRRLDLHPSHVRFRTARTRFRKSAWVTIDELAGTSSWGEIDARAHAKTKSLTASTSGVSQLTFARDELLFGDASIRVTIDGQLLTFDEGEPLVMGRPPRAGGSARGAWQKGALTHAGPFKHAAVTGPIRDVFSEPILFVYGAADASEARANEQVARAFAKIRPGVQVSYPIMSDTEFLAKSEPLANDRALFLVGRTNLVLAKLEAMGAFPIRIEAGAVTVGSERFTGKELGAAFVRPNPARPDRYVVVVAGADVPGTLRALSLPDLLPDFVVWDERVAPSRGQVVLGAGSLRAGGIFDKEWALPTAIGDPRAKARPAVEPSPPAEEPAEEPATPTMSP